MLKLMFALGMGVALFGNVSQAASVYYYDTLKVTAILENKDVAAKFAGQKLANGASANSLQGIEMGTADPAHSQIHFQVKSAGCSFPVVISFDRGGWNPNYQVVSIGDWNCPARRRN